MYQKKNKTMKTLAKEEVLGMLYGKHMAEKDKEFNQLLNGGGKNFWKGFMKGLKKGAKIAIPVGTALVGAPELAPVAGLVAEATIGSGDGKSEFSESVFDKIVALKNKKET